MLLCVVIVQRVEYMDLFFPVNVIVLASDVLLSPMCCAMHYGSFSPTQCPGGLVGVVVCCA